MKKFVAKLLIVSQLLCNFAFAGKIQNEDVKSLSDLTGAGGSAAQLINDSKIYVTANGLNEQLSAAITNGDIGGAAANGINYFSNFKANGTTGFSTCNETQTFTVTIASPAVFTSASSHGFAVGQALTFSTSGVLPTGLTAGTTYYVSAVPSGTTYRVSATLGGADVNTSGSQSGTQTQYPATPITCSSGSLSGLALTASSVSPLRYTSSFLLTQTNSAKVQGQGIAYNYTIANADQAKMINVSFDYNASSTFVASSGQAGATGTSGIDSDLEIYMYDVTNAVPIPISPKVITANGANNYTYKGSFQTNANSTSYRMIVYASTPNANATGWTFKFVNVQISPQIANTFGAPVTDWQPYNLVIGATTTAPTPGTIVINSAEWRRIGDSMEITYNFQQSSAGTAGSGTYLFPLPGGYSIDTNKLTPTTTIYGTVVGSASYGDSGGTDGSVGSVKVYNSTNLAVNAITSTTAASKHALMSSSISPLSGAATIGISFTALVPIVGWASTTVLSQDTDTRVVAASYYASTAQSISPTQPANYDSKLWDTHGAVTVGSSWNFRAPISGFYVVSGFVESSSTSGAGWIIYKNGAPYKPAADPANAQYGSGFSVQVQMNAGDTVDFRKVNSGTIAGGALGGSGTSFIDITRISGPATIATTESVYALYTVTGSVSLSTTVPWNATVKELDTHNAVQIASASPTGLWRFNVPVSGTYEFCNYGISGGETIMLVYKNGTLSGRTGSLNVAESGGCRLVKAVAGDFLDTRSSSGGASNTSDTSGGNYISIKRIGN